MQHNIATQPSEIPSDFTSTQIALLNEIRDKAIATVRKDGVKMSEINSALNVLIKVEKQFFLLTHRRPPGHKGKKTRRETASILPFAPDEDSAQTHSSPPTPSEPSPETILPAPSLPNQLESSCDLEQIGFLSQSCRGCINGKCSIQKG